MPISIADKIQDIRKAPLFHWAKYYAVVASQDNSLFKIYKRQWQVFSLNYCGRLGFLLEYFHFIVYIQHLYLIIETDAYVQQRCAPPQIISYTYTP